MVDNGNDQVMKLTVSGNENRMQPMITKAMMMKTTMTTTTVMMRMAVLIGNNDGDSDEADCQLQ